MVKYQRYWWVIFWGCSLLSVKGQSVFEAYTDARQVGIDGVFDVDFVLRNAEGRQFIRPSFKGFKIIQGPDQSMRASIINGRAVRELTYSFTLQAKTIGKYTIEPASITVNGKKLTSNPLVVEVVPLKDLPKVNTNATFFIRAEPQLRDIWIGQQVIVDYKLYTKVDVETYNIVAEADYHGFYAEDIRRHNTRKLQEVFDGESYTTKVIKRIVLFPQRAGMLEIDPLTVQLGLNEDASGRKNRFSFGKALKREVVSTPPIKINVSPLPENAPEGFTGAVGKWEMSTAGSPTNITTDDAFTLRVLLKGDGDLRRIQNLEINWPESFETFSPEIINEWTNEQTGQVIAEKELKYVVVPKKPGTYQVTPTLVYFDTDSETFEKISAATINLVVDQGSNRSRVSLPEVDANDQEESAKELLGLKESIKVYPVGSRFFRSSTFWVLFFMPFLVLAVAIMVWWRKKQISEMDPAVLKMQKARKQALKRLDQAKTYMEEGKSRAFYDEVSKSMLGYVSDKLSIPRSALSKQNVAEKLQSLNVPTSAVNDFTDILNAAELAIFAGKDKSDEMQGIYQQALQILSTIESGISRKS